MPDESSADRQAIHKLVDTWMAASKAGDLTTVLGLMADDVIFTVPGREPFGKEAFVAGSEAMKGAQIDGKSQVQELQVLGEWAWMRNRLRIRMTLPDGTVARRAGYTLTILKKKSNGGWVIFRDANMLAPE